LTPVGANPCRGRRKFGELPRHQQRMCRTYGAPDFSCNDSQAFWLGLTFTALTALAPRGAAATRRRIMTKPISAVRVVFFDFGFTLWDEERAWNAWARWLGVPTYEFFAVLGSVIERGEHHHRAFEIVRPGFDLEREREQRREAGESDGFRPEELYPDVIPCLRELRSAGYRAGVAGNYFADFAETLRAINLPIDFIGSSEEWEVQKPSPEFFARMVEISGVAPQEIAYVGDRVDNDVLPAKAAGMVSVFLRRGPWGLIHARRAEAEQADIRIDTLADLRGALEKRVATGSMRD
jgi:HAD superfamily hydrolase (TIGR01549 family)